jgi:hypothetical protein
MDRTAAMLDRLPPIYRVQAGSLIDEVLRLVALQMEIFDEDLDRVQRSHWIGDAFDRDDLTKIGSLVGVAPESWEPDTLYRARLETVVAARLRGAVTPASLELVLTRLLGAAQELLGVRYLAILPEGPGAPDIFQTTQSDWQSRPTFLEFPTVRRRSDDLVAKGGLLQPHDHFTLTNRGLEATQLQLVVRGMAGGRTAVPLIVNLTNGTAIGYAGVVRCGEELHLTVGADGKLDARLNDVDVRARVYTTAQFQAGVPFTPQLPDPQPRPIQLERGDNDLWFISLALFDVPGLDAAMLAMATPDQVQGTFAAKDQSATGTTFDRAVFFQPPAVVLDAFWNERVPATFRFDIPAGVVRRDADPLHRRSASEHEQLRVRLFALLAETVDLLRAAAVDGQVRARSLEDQQRMSDRCTILGAQQQEQASSGVDVLAALSALFDVTATDGSRME